VLTNSRNFLVAYGLLDYGLILGFSLVTSMLAFGVARGARTAWNARKARRLAKTAPTTEDTPLQILKKLALLKGENLFQQCNLAAARIQQTPSGRSTTAILLSSESDACEFASNEPRRVRGPGSRTAPTW
jgi:hypothetical protein